MNEPPSREAVLLGEALALPASQREAYLNEACGGDAHLRHAVQALLDANEDAGAFLETASTGGRLLASAANPLLAAAENAVPISEKPGDKIGRYKLLQQIGEGGCGVVYMAEQEEPVRRRVALKVIKLGMDTKSVIARFEAERQALAMMDHPNIAKVLDAGATETGRPYFVMELVRGIRITEYCDQLKLSTRERLNLFISVCQAVQHAHQKGIIHRDLKPSNVLVTEHDGVAVPKIIDFGIAKATSDQRLTDKTLFTAFEQFIGTPAYTSPEQAGMGGLDIDTRSDIYSLGVLLYELLTGRPPFSPAEFQRSAIDEILRVIREREPARPSARVTALSERELTSVAQQRQVESAKLSAILRGDLDWIVMKCLEKDRSHRYETANGLAADLQRHLSNEPVVARPPSTAYRLQKLIRRNKLAFAAGTTIVASLVIGIAASVWQAVRATHAEKKTAAERDAKELARQDAEAISKFLGEVFQSPDPARDGRTVTVAETLDKAAKKLDTDLATQPDRRAKLQATLGSTYSALGLYREAIPLQEKVRDYHLATSGLEHPDTLLAMHNLAISYFNAGRRDEALKLREEVLALRRKVSGPEHPETLTAMKNLTGSYAHAGRLNEALKLFKEVLALSRKVSGPDFDTLTAVSGLSRVPADVDEALKLREEALALSRKVSGPEHPDTLTAMNNLTFTYDVAGRGDEALKLREEALALSRKVLGPEHPDTLTAMRNLAFSYGGADRRHEALKLCEKVLALRRKVSGPEHPDTLTAMQDLANAYMSGRNYAQAEPLLSEFLARARKSAGTNSSELEGRLAEMADLRHRQKRYADAEALYRERIESLRRAGGETSDTVLGTRASLGRLYSDWAWAERATAGAAAHERAIEGEKLLREAISVREQDAKYPAWRKAELQSRLGGALSVVAFTDQGLTATTREPKLVEAESALQRGQDGMEQDKATQTKYKRDGVDRLIRLYEAWLKPDKLAEWKRKRTPFDEAEAKKSKPGQP